MTVYYLRSEPKQYKIRVVNRLGNLMDKTIFGEGDKTWNDLNGQSLKFRLYYRPQARYLYFHYCTTRLRRLWVTLKATDVLKDELGKLFCETPGRYMPTNQLRTFVEEMGYEYEALMQGTISEETEKAQDESTIDIGLAAAYKTIQLSSSQIATAHSLSLVQNPPTYRDDNEEALLAFSPVPPTKQEGI